eukprot:858467-Prorocentrum_minimum.AAC.1
MKSQLVMNHSRPTWRIPYRGLEDSRERVVAFGLESSGESYPNVLMLCRELGLEVGGADVH